jgi:biopolymer transport protein ExbD
MRQSPSALLAISLSISLLAAACESKPSPNPFETKKETVEPPPMKEAPKPQGPPEFVVSGEGPKVGWTYVLLEKADGKQKLAAAIAEQKDWVSGKNVPLRVDRQAKLAHVGEMMSALTEAGATSVTVSTDTRTEFPKAVVFTALSALLSKPHCAVVAKVLTERRNAVWSLAGGTAVRSPKGLAGPDMAMTEDNLSAAAKRCKESDVVFVSGDEDVEWGLVYDLSAATKVLEKVTFAKVVLLEPAPVAGRPGKLE